MPQARATLRIAASSASGLGSQSAAVRYSAMGLFVVEVIGGIERLDAECATGVSLRFDC